MSLLLRCVMILKEPPNWNQYGTHAVSRSTIISIKTHDLKWALVTLPPSSPTRPPLRVGHRVMFDGRPAATLQRRRVSPSREGREQEKSFFRCSKNAFKCFVETKAITLRIISFPSKEASWTRVRYPWLS